MKDCGRTDLNETKYYNLCLFLLKRLGEASISSYGVWVFLRFILLFGEREVSNHLEELAQLIGVQHKKLRSVLGELAEKKNAGN